ncbi:hypothetical protein CMO91_01655 [Candidatus Woesearchaeota archaeon]|nr:hypothetical protein [Candidatus Woesearchaeota archaeon]
MEARGCMVKSSKQSSKRPVNWIICLVMSILFGTLGVDRFIMGHVGLGILKLIPAGGCGIWWLVDLILIATKHPFQDIEWVED